MQGLRLLLKAPRLYHRDCNDCLAHQYSEETGERLERGGQPQKRHFACPPPCRTPEGCPKGTAENQNVLLPKNREAFRHYQECEAVGFSTVEARDSIVRRNASIIKTEKDAQRRRQDVEMFRDMISEMRR